MNHKEVALQLTLRYGKIIAVSIATTNKWTKVVDEINKL